MSVINAWGVSFKMLFRNSNVLNIQIAKMMTVIFGR